MLQSGWLQWLAGELANFAAAKMQHQEMPTRWGFMVDLSWALHAQPDLHELWQLPCWHCTRLLACTVRDT